jgi:hypothetical protein
MADKLYDEQLRWAKLLRGGPVEIELVEVLVQELPENSQPALASPAAPEVKPCTNGFGNCKLCRKHRRLWSGVCAWCGADFEDFEGETE